MAAEVPRELSILLNPPDPDSLEAAWSGFVRRHNKLFLKASATLGGGYDDRMDRYRSGSSVRRKGPGPLTGRPLPS